MSATNIQVDLEFTPNPNTLKYVVSETLLVQGAANFRQPADATGKSGLAEGLFALNDIAAVMVGKNFVTVTLSNQDQLTDLNEKIIDCIKAYVASGKPAVEQAALQSTQNEHGQAKGAIEEQIIQILDNEIRPAVAMDGGDITFEKFEDGIVFLHMQGSCAGCPSSTATLKMGIENRLKDAIPQVLEVVSV